MIDDYQAITQRVSSWHCVAVMTNTTYLSNGSVHISINSYHIILTSWIVLLLLLLHPQHHKPYPKKVHLTDWLKVTHKHNSNSIPQACCQIVFYLCFFYLCYKGLYSSNQLICHFLLRISDSFVFTFIIVLIVSSQSFQVSHEALFPHFFWNIGLLTLLCLCVFPVDVDLQHFKEDIKGINLFLSNKCS